MGFLAHAPRGADGCPRATGNAHLQTGGGSPPCRSVNTPCPLRACELDGRGCDVVSLGWASGAGDRYQLLTCLSGLHSGGR